jgi:hypothetical protein
MTTSGKQETFSAFRPAARVILSYKLGNAPQRLTWRRFSDRGDETLRLVYAPERHSAVLDISGFADDRNGAIQEDCANDTRAESIEVRDVAEALPSLRIQHVSSAETGVVSGKDELLKCLAYRELAARFDHLQVQFWKALQHAHLRANDKDFMGKAWI